MLAAVLGMVVGVVIGGLGGGGGVLTVPALVYVLGQSAQDATTSSLVIVGITAVVGVLARVRGGLVRWRTGLAFGAVGIPSAALGTLVNQQVAEPVLLLSFAALTVLAAVALIVDSRRTPAAPGDPVPPAAARGGVDVAAPPAVAPSRLGQVAKIVGCGVVIGFLTGFLGVGGGFLMVPALVIVLRMPMTYAVGTSLLIISINSVAAFATRAGVAEFDWAVLVPFTVAAVAGSFLGKIVGQRLSSAVLSRAFAVLLLLVGASVAVESILSLAR
jgi:uncharacterized membrane protein YfcA